jgi:hypothetical protein
MATNAIAKIAKLKRMQAMLSDVKTLFLTKMITHF